MENYKVLPIKDINKEIFSMLGMDITVFEFIDYAKKNTFSINKIISHWEELDDLSILKELALPERKNKYIFILTDDLYYKKKVLKINEVYIGKYVSDYFNENGVCFFNGNVVFILKDKNKVIQFNDDGYIIHYETPLILIEKGMSKYLKNKCIE